MEEKKQNETVQRIVTDCPDSLDIGTPGKGGAIKVYGNASDKETYQKKLDNMLELRANAQAKMGE